MKKRARSLTLKQFATLGGHARAAKLNPDQRRMIARNAAKARWAADKAKKIA